MREWETGEAENRGFRWNVSRKKGRRESDEEEGEGTKRKQRRKLFFCLLFIYLFFLFYQLPESLLSHSSLPAFSLMGAEPEVAGTI